MGRLRSPKARGRQAGGPGESTVQLGTEGRNLGSRIGVHKPTLNAQCKMGPKRGAGRGSRPAAAGPTGAPAPGPGCRQTRPTQHPPESRMCMERPDLRSVTQPARWSPHTPLSRLCPCKRRAAGGAVRAPVPRAAGERRPPGRRSSHSPPPLSKRQTFPSRRQQVPPHKEPMFHCQRQTKLRT